MRLAILGFLLSTLCFAAPTTVRVVDASGAPLKDVLVIVKSFGPSYFDDIRQLTDEQGRIPTLELKPGAYQAIATTPYGLWETSVKEFLVEDKPVELTLRVSPQPTHGVGDIVTVGSSHTEIKVLTPAGTPAPGAKVFTRDKDATLYLERWYKTDKEGKAQIELVADPTVLVIIYGGKLFTTQLAPSSTHATIRFSPD